MDISFIELLIIIILIAFFGWLVQLKKRVSQLELELSSRPPEPDKLSIQDLQKLQTTLLDLVDEFETYSEDQMRRIGLQAEALKALSKRIENRLQYLENTIEQEPIQTISATRVIPIATKQFSHNYKDHDRIMELHQQGWSFDEIAKELRITKGEVQLIVNLS